MLRRAIQALHAASLTGAARRFERAARDPRSAQESRLTALLRANENTAFGREHDYANLESTADFQHRVPVREWRDFEPYVARAVRGEAGVLTEDPIRVFEPTSGSGAARKLVPYTRALLDEFAAATGPWLRNLHMQRPALRGTTSYWSVSPLSGRREVTPGGTPIGFEDDAEYFSPLVRWALARTRAVPAEVGKLRDVEEWRRATLRHLLDSRSLGLISVWSPSFLTELMEHLGEVTGASPPNGEALWPRLALISCWTDAGAADQLDALRRWFPSTEIQGKGLLATEGVVSFPLLGVRDPVLAVAGHFFEFEDEHDEDRRPRLAHELKPGDIVRPILTTGGGLTRYRTGDLIECTGRYHATPTVRFLGRGDRASDLCGEKLDERLVTFALDAARRTAGLKCDFALLAPASEAPLRYRLFVDSVDDDAVLTEAGRALEAQLREAHHYDHARDLGQLAPLEVLRVPRAWERYVETLVARGARAGDVKPTHLDARPIWDEAFGACP